jgi:hypothetical protein
MSFFALIFFPIVPDLCHLTNYNIIMNNKNNKNLVCKLHLRASCHTKLHSKIHGTKKKMCCVSAIELPLNMNKINPNDGKFFTWKWKRSQKFLWQLPDGICFWDQKWKLTPVRPIPSVIRKEKFFTADGRATDFFFVKTVFSKIKSPNSSRQSIIFFFWNH